jgi:DNA-binding response OmpR family regulator
MGIRGTLLCVEDDFRCVMIRKLLLQSFGFKVLTSTSPRTALNIFAAEPIEGVVVDYHLPEMDGSQMAAAMREIKPHVPILMLSAQPSLPESALGLVDAFVPKGTPAEVLVSELDQIMAARSIRG